MSQTFDSVDDLKQEAAEVWYAQHMAQEWAERSKGDGS